MGFSYAALSQLSRCRCDVPSQPSLSTTVKRQTLQNLTHGLTMNAGIPEAERDVSLRGNRVKNKDEVRFSGRECLRVMFEEQSGWWPQIV